MDSFGYYNGHIWRERTFCFFRWLITPFRDNGYLSPRQRKFNQTLSSLRSVVEQSIRLLNGCWRKLGFLDHIDLELTVHLILASCVLHNYCLLKDDFDEGYFLDDGDDDHDNYGSNGSDTSNDSTPGGQDGLRAAEAKRVQLMNIVA